MRGGIPLIATCGPCAATGERLRGMCIWRAMGDGLPGVVARVGEDLGLIGSETLHEPCDWLGLLMCVSSRRHPEL